MKILIVRRISIIVGAALFLIASLFLFQGCGGGKGFLSREQQQDLIRTLLSAGVDACFMGDVFRPGDFPPPSGQGFIIGVQRFREKTEASINDIREVVTPVIEEYLSDKEFIYKYVIVEIGGGYKPSSFVIIPSKKKETNRGNSSSLEKHFQADDISFDYPKDWVSWEKTSFERIRNLIKSQRVDADLLVLLKSPDGSCIFQVVKLPNSSSFDSFYRDRKAFADQVTAQGIEIMGERYLRYSVTTVDLPSNQKFLLSHAEKPNGETAINYQFLSDGYEYDVNFIYKSTNAAEKDEKLREKVMRTLKIAVSKE
jgi:hypothetical protein